MIRIRSLFCIVCVVSCTLWSQQPEAPQPPRLRFLFIDESPGHYDLKLGRNGYQQISAGPYEISAPYTPADTKPLEIFKTLPDPITGETRPVKIATVQPPANTPSVLVLITPRPAASANVPPVYQVELINCDPAAFPAGSVRVINRGKVALGTQFGSAQAVTESGATNILRPATDSRHRVFFKIAVQNPHESSGWELLQHSLTVIPPSHRLYGILVFSPSGMKHMLTASELAELGPPPPGHFWLTFSDSP